MSQQGLLATYLIPGCVGRGVSLGSETLSGGAAGGSGNLSGNLEIWESGNMESQKDLIIRMKICHAQNVGRVLISRKTDFQGSRGAIFTNCSMGRKKIKIRGCVCNFPLVVQWGPICPVWGQLKHVFKSLVFALILHPTQAAISFCGM